MSTEVAAALRHARTSRRTGSRSRSARGARRRDPADAAARGRALSSARGLRHGPRDEDGDGQTCTRPASSAWTRDSGRPRSRSPRRTSKLGLRLPEPGRDVRPATVSRRSRSRRESAPPHRSPRDGGRPRHRQHGDLRHAPPRASCSPPAKLRDVVGFPTSRATADEARRLGDPPALRGPAARDRPDDRRRRRGGPRAQSHQGRRRGALPRKDRRGGEPARRHRRGRVEALRRARNEARPSRRGVALRLAVAAALSRVARRDAGAARWRRTAKPYETDQGNWILDCAFGPIADPAGLAARLAARAGIIEHGLFCGIASQVIVAGEDGIRELHRP